MASFQGLNGTAIPSSNEPHSRPNQASVLALEGVLPKVRKTHTASARFGVELGLAQALHVQNAQAAIFDPNELARLQDSQRFIHPLP